MAESINLKGKHLQRFLESSNYLGKRGVLYDEYDEPTYFSFWIEFPDFTTPEALKATNYDHLPNGLLYKEDSDYSAERYLRSINENKRADAIAVFRQLLSDISRETPYYIKEISGLETIYEIDPEKNNRDEARLTIAFDEALDNRMTALFDTYRKAAYDEKYQRWVLPDIMRMFKMEIYVTEFRRFHIPRYNERRSVEDGSRLTGDGRNINDPINGSAGFFDQIGKFARDPEGTLGGIVDDAADRISGRPGERLSESDYFLKVMDRNFSILKFELQNCEFDLKSFKPSWTETINNNTGTEKITGTVEIKVGEVNESNQYTVLGAAAGLALKRLDSYFFSDKDSNERTQQGYDQELYQKIIGDDNTENSDQVYNNSSYKEGHLRKTEDQGKKSLGERLIDDLQETSTTQLESATESKLEELATGLLLGNVYGLSPASLARRLSADPRAIADSLEDIIRNSLPSDEANAFLSNIYDNLPEPSSDLESNRLGNNGLTGPNVKSEGTATNIGLTGPNPKPAEGGNIGLTGPSSSDSNLSNIGLTGGESNPGNPGNIGLSGGNSDIEGNPGNAGLTGGESNIEGSTDNAGLSGPNATIEGNPGNSGLSGPNVDIDGNAGNAGLTGASSNQGDLSNIGLSGGNSNTQGNPGNAGLTGGESNIEGSTDNAGLQGAEVSSDGNPGNAGLQGNNVSSEGSEENIGLDGPNISSEGNPGNAGLSGSKSESGNPGNVGLQGDEVSIEGEGGNVGLSGDKPIKGNLNNVGLTGDEPKNKIVGNIGLTGEESKDSDLRNAGLTGDEPKESSGGNVGLTGEGKSNDNILGNINLQGEHKEDRKLENIGLDGPDKISSKLGNVGLDGPELEKQKPGNVGLSGTGDKKDPREIGNTYSDESLEKKTKITKRSPGIPSDRLGTGPTENVYGKDNNINTSKSSQDNIGLTGYSKEEHTGEIQSSKGDQSRPNPNE